MKPLKLIVSALILPAALYGQSGQSRPSITLEKETIEGLGLSSTPVGKHLVVDPVTATAEVTLDPTRTRTIATFFPGHLELDLVQPGDEVKEGQTLAHLKSREVAGVITQWLKADRQFETAALLYEREGKLRPKKLTTEDAFLAAQASYQEALANRTAALQTALLARSREELLTLREDEGLRDLTKLPIVSPLGGTIIKKSAYAGDTVELDTELFEVADLDELLIEIRVPLKAATFLKVGDSLEFHTIVGEKRIDSATVSRIDPVVDRTALAVPVFARLDNTSRQWRVGTPVNVHLIDTAAGKVTAVPSTSLVTIAGSPHLFLAQGGNRFQPIEVTTGQSSQAFTEITSNLPGGARVVDSGASLLLAAWEDRTSE